MLTRYAALAAVVVGCAVFASTASADPSGKTSFAFSAGCDNGQTIEVVVNGNGEWTPAHIVGSTSVFVPRAFDTTFEFTPVGGPTEAMTDTSAKKQHGDLVTCSFDATQTIPDVGTFRIFGTATGIFTPA